MSTSTMPAPEWITDAEGHDLYRTEHRRSGAEPATTRPRPARARSGPAGVLRRAAGEFLYTVMDLGVAIAFFVLTVTLLSVGLGLSVIWVGVPILVIGLAVARFGGSVQRGLARTLLAAPLAGPGPIAVRGSGPIARVGALLRDGASWRAFGYFCCKILLAPVTFTVAVTLYAYGLGAVTYPLWRWSLPAMQGSDGSWHRGTPLWTDVWVDTSLLMAVQFVLGVGVLYVAYHAVRALTTLDRALMGRLLTR